VPAAICQGRTIIAQTARAAKNGSQTCGSGEKNKMANVSSSGHCLCDLGILQPLQRDMPRDFARYAKVGEVDPESWLCFYIDGCTTVGTIALKWLIFKQEKGCAAISLALITAPWAHLNHHLVTLSL
jgi:hypothetical protein